MDRHHDLRPLVPRLGLEQVLEWRMGASKSSSPDVRVGGRHGWGYPPFRLAHFLFTYTRTASMAGHIWKQRRYWTESAPAWKALLFTAEWYCLGRPKSPGGTGLKGKRSLHITRKVDGRAWTGIQSS